MKEKLLGGLEHDWLIFSIYQECHHPNSLFFKGVETINLENYLRIWGSGKESMGEKNMGKFHHDRSLFSLTGNGDSG